MFTYATDTFAPSFESPHIQLLIPPLDWQPMHFDAKSEILPQELFSLIIESARDNRRTLLNLCLVSKSFLPGSRRFLYQRVDLGGIQVVKVGCGGWGLSNVGTDNIFFKTLAGTPCLAHYVREFSYRPSCYHGGDRFWSAFRQAFSQMVNLKRLQLTLMTGDRGILKELCGHPFQLEAFTLRDYRWSQGDDYRTFFPSFISSQPYLQTLEVLSRIPSLPVPPQSCQNLTTFIGNVALALPLLRSHPITNYVWTGGLYMPTSSDGESEFSKLRVLVFRNYFPVMECAQLTDCLRSLEVLQISFDEHSGVPGGRTLKSAAGLVSNLSMLKKLRLLVWTGLDINGQDNESTGNKMTFQGVAPHFFEDNAALEYVYYSGHKSLCGPHLQWDRGEMTPVQVEVDDYSDFYKVLGFDSRWLDQV